MAVSGLLLHARIHPFLTPDKANPDQMLFRGSYVAATFLPILDVVLVTLLFSFRRTAAYGYLLNGLLVIYGTVLMGHFAIAKLASIDAPLYIKLFKSTLPDIGLAWADFLVGAVLYTSWRKDPQDS
jgi:hypothetical protein